MAVLSRSRPWPDRVAVAVSAVPIAVLCNVVRIVTTGLVYHAGYKELGDRLCHDLFGWLMMPLALGLIWVELKLIDWLLVPVPAVTQDDLFRALRPGRVGA